MRIIDRCLFLNKNKKQRIKLADLIKKFKLDVNTYKIKFNGKTIKL